MVSLLSLTRVDDQALSGAAAQAVCHLSAGPDTALANRVRLGGAVPALVDGPLARVAEDPVAAYWAAKALGQIAGASQACRTAVALAEGCLPGLVALVDYGVPWDAGIDSPRRSARPTPDHKRAAKAAALALLAVMLSEEGAAAAADAIAEAAKGSPRIGQALGAASKRLLAMLQAVARERLHVAQTGKEGAALEEALAFSRAVAVPKSENGAARRFFDATKERRRDQKKHPWRYGDGVSPIAGVGIPLPTPPASSLRHAAPQAAPQAARAHGLGSPRASSSPTLRLTAARPRDTRDGASLHHGGGGPPASPRSASPRSSRRSAADEGGGAGTPPPDLTVMVPPSPSVAAPSSPRAAPPTVSSLRSSSSSSSPGRRLAHAHVAFDGDESPPPPPPRLESHGGHGGSQPPPQVEAIVAGAEAQMEEQLRSMRAVLVQSLSALTQEAKVSESALRNENRRLQQALAQAHAREAEYESKLRQASSLITGLVV